MEILTRKERDPGIEAESVEGSSPTRGSSFS